MYMYVSMVQIEIHQSMLPEAQTNSNYGGMTKQKYSIPTY